MIEKTIGLTEEQADVLRQGYPVRIAAPELDGELVVVLAVAGESTERVLQETVDDLREKEAWANLGLEATAARIREDQ